MICACLCNREGELYKGEEHNSNAHQDCVLTPSVVVSILVGMPKFFLKSIFSYTQIST